MHPGDRNLPFLPTLHQELLLKACLSEDDDTLTAWRAWSASTDLDEIDIGSLRLLPLLADKLRSLGVKDPAVEKYRGVQRLTWARNQLLFRAASALSKQLKAAKIPVMALKGIVLATTYYKTTSPRYASGEDRLAEVSCLAKS